MFYWHQSYHGNVMTLRYLLAFVFLGTRSLLFFKNRLRVLAPPLVALIMIKFEQILWERFRNILNKVLRVRKTLNEHAIDRISYYLKKTIRSELMQFHLIVVWFHLNLCTKKEGDCVGRLREKRIWLDYVRLLSLHFLSVIWSMPTNFYLRWENISNAHLEFCKLISNLVLDQIVVSNLANVHKLGA